MAISEITDVIKELKSMYSSEIAAAFIELKRKNDLFRRVKLEKRNEYLIQGICEREVDKLLEHAEMFGSLYIPVKERWELFLSIEENMKERVEMVLKEKSLLLQALSDSDIYHILWFLNSHDLSEWNEE
jgi:hypothetical protein